MPREIVVAAKTEGPGQTEVQVHWSRDKHVQLSVQKFRSEPTEPLPKGYGSSLPKRSAYVESFTPPDVTPSFHSEEPIWTDELSRSEINNFIRVLRRARDQAHGRDE